MEARIDDIDLDERVMDEISRIVLIADEKRGATNLARDTLRREKPRRDLTAPPLRSSGPLPSGRPTEP